MPLIAPTAVRTLSASALAPTSAQLNGLVAPLGLETTASFDYGTSPTLASGVVNVTATPPPGSDTGFVTVHAAIMGLTPGTTYYYRIKGANIGGGTAQDVIVMFTTPLPPAPVILQEGIEGPARSTASLFCDVKAQGFPTTVVLQYGTSAVLAGASSVAAGPSPVSGANFDTVSALATGLAANTQYYYRFVATNVGGTTPGTIQSFTTLPLPPEICTPS